MNGSTGKLAALETPSGKGAGDENFPVGSFLLPRRLRPHVARYYAFARAIDDIADNPALADDDKVARLGAFADAIHGKAGGPGLEKAMRLRESLLETKVPLRHASDLTVAFIQDARKSRYADWRDLMGYCENSANPVGRYLLALHGETDPAAYAASDALCSALQVLNHLQDCGDDYRNLDRVYLPQDWIAAEGARTEELGGKALTPALRIVLDRTLTATDELLAGARALAGLLSPRRLAMESAAIWRIARRLSALLKAADPLAGRVKLSKTQFLACGLGGSLAATLRIAEGRRP
ncbi:MAG TPA: squalene synthase HpnC [Kiloniellales bacterium]|nr:squalene synthase HpnC [Kiloniellales bacterium]